MKKICFTTGLPRSGTTLFQNILAQNPNFYASGTSGMLELIYGARKNFTDLPEFKSQDIDLMNKSFKSFCLGGCQGWYDGLTDRPVCFDKSRGWIHYYEFLASFIPNPKVLFVVRDIRGCLSSLEKKFRQNMFRHDANDNPAQLQWISVEDRVNTWLQSPPLGLALKRTYGAIQRGVINKVLVVRFEDLTNNPKSTMQKVYDYIEEPWFEHDFNNIQQFTIEDDSEYGFYGDHKIRSEVKPIKADWKEVLGNAISKNTFENNKWFYENLYPEKVS
jgi:sulfotransferase